MSVGAASVEKKSKRNENKKVVVYDKVKRPKTNEIEKGQQRMCTRKVWHLHIRNEEEVSTKTPNTHDPESGQLPTLGVVIKVLEAVRALRITRWRPLLTVLSRDRL